MVEAKNFSEKYAKLSPRECNEELRWIIDSILSLEEDGDYSEQRQIEDRRFLMDTPSNLSPSDIESLKSDELRGTADRK